MKILEEQIRIDCPDFERKVYCILGLPFDAVNLHDVCRLVREAAAQRTPYFISTPNINFIITCLKDAEFRQSVFDSHLSTADGMPIIWVARLLGIPLFERVTGSGMFELLMETTKERLNVYFFGGPDGAAEKAGDTVNQGTSALRCVGFQTPGFGSVEGMSADGTIAKINDANPDFVVVALGAKKGNAWIQLNRAKLRAPVISHLGAVVNFLAGDVKRAPKMLQAIGFEWLWRIYEEPHLWKRYAVDGLQLVKLFFSRVIPYAVWLKRHKSQIKFAQPLSVKVNNESESLISLSLSGQCSAQTIEPLQKYLSENAFKTTSFELDLQNVDYIDSAFVGLCILIKTCTKNHNGYLNFFNLSPAVKQVFIWCCAEYLLL